MKQKNLNNLVPAPKTGKGKKPTPEERACHQAEQYDLQRKHNRRHTYIQLCSIVIFALSGWLTTKGFFDVAIEGAVATTEGMLTSSMLAATATTALGTATLMLYSVAANAFKAQRFSVIALACILVPFIFGISTVSNIIASTGSVAVVRDMRIKASAHENYYRSVSKGTVSVKSTEAALAPLAASLCDMDEGEGTHGAITGSAGKQAVYASYFSACTSMQKMLEIIQNTTMLENDRHDAADKILQALQSIPEDVNLSIFERQAAFRLKVRELRSLIARSHVESLPEQINMQMNVLQTSIIALDTHDNAFGKRQSGAIAGLKNTLSNVSEIINKLTESSSTKIANPPDNLLNLITAIRTYWTEFLPQVALAILVDMLGLWFVCLLIVSRRTIELHKKSPLIAN